MKIKAVCLTSLVLIFILFAAGCSGPAPQPPATTVPTTIPTIEVVTTAIPTTTPGGSIVPGPTQTMPSAIAVSVSVDKAGMYSTQIITSFDGGKGMNQVSRIEVRVTHPDGSIVTGTMKPIIGETLELAGTNGTDRVEVTVVMMSGTTYKLIDQQMPYKTRG